MAMLNNQMVYMELYIAHVFALIKLGSFLGFFCHFTREVVMNQW